MADRQKLTKTVIDRLGTVQEGRRLVVYDTHPDAPVGFGLRKTHTGAVSFFLEFGAAHSRRRLTIGRFGDPWTVQTARERAIILRAEVKQGDDPAEEQRRRRAVPDWRGWVAEYLASLDKKNPSPDRYYLQGHEGGRRKGAAPRESEAMRRWGGKRIDQITPQDVESLRSWVQEQAAKTLLAKRAADRGPDTRPGITTANRWLASVRACLAAAERAGLISTNPAVAVRPRRENPPRARFLSDEEFGRLAEAVATHEDGEVRVLLTLMMTTGARQSEARQARWDDLDLTSSRWTIPSPKAGRPQDVPLPPVAVAALRSLPSRSEHVFPSPRDPARPRGHLRRPWARLLEAAGLPGDINAHDLRRTFCRRAVDAVGRDVASRLLRHSDSRVTDRIYNPRSFDELLDATQAVNREHQDGLGELVAFRKAEQ